MAILNPYTTANKHGIPRIETNSVNVTTDRVTFAANTNQSFYGRYNGLVAFKIANTTPDATTGTLPVYINEMPLRVFGGASATASDIIGTGILLCWYDSSENLLQAINLV